MSDNTTGGNVDTIGEQMTAAVVKLILREARKPMTLKQIKAEVRKTSRVIDIAVYKPYVMVEVRAKARNLEGHSLAFAKCNPIDVWDEQRGHDIAKGRAEVHIARMLHERLRDA